MTDIDGIVNEILYAVSQSLIDEDKHEVFESIVSVLSENDIDIEQYVGIDTVLDEVISSEAVDPEDSWDDDDDDEWEEDQDYDEDE